MILGGVTSAPASYLYLLRRLFNQENDIAQPPRMLANAPAREVSRGQPRSPSWLACALGG
jgi:hypothetical protein